MQKVKDIIQGLNHDTEQMLELGWGLPEGQEVFRRIMLQVALAKENGNKCRAAKVLKIHRNSVARIQAVKKELPKPQPAKKEPYSVPVREEKEKKAS